LVSGRNKWLAAEDEIADPMAGLRPPHVPDRPVPVFVAEDLLRLERVYAGRSFQQRRDAAMIAVFRATGMRLSELAGIRYDPGDPRRGDIDLWQGSGPNFGLLREFREGIGPLQGVVRRLGVIACLPAEVSGLLQKPAIGHPARMPEFSRERFTQPPLGHVLQDPAAAGHELERSFAHARPLEAADQGGPLTP
jgi:hypothetical protein